jgi:hypothetical protein
MLAAPLGNVNRVRPDSRKVVLQWRNNSVTLHRRHHPKRCSCRNGVMLLAPHDNRCGRGCQHPGKESTECRVLAGHFFSMQNTLFVVLTRILDSDSDVHSIHHVVNATIAHPEFFNHDALRAGKLGIPGG